MTPIRKRMLKVVSLWRKWDDYDKLLRAWLKKADDDKAVSCPWAEWDYPHEICKAMFPRMEKCRGNPESCPCMVYNIKYVTKRAKEALK